MAMRLPLVVLVLLVVGCGGDGGRAPVAGEDLVGQGLAAKAEADRFRQHMVESAAAAQRSRDQVAARERLERERLAAERTEEAAASPPLACQPAPKRLADFDGAWSFGMLVGYYEVKIAGGRYLARSEDCSGAAGTVTYDARRSRLTLRAGRKTCLRSTVALTIKCYTPDSILADYEHPQELHGPADETDLVRLPKWHATYSGPRYDPTEAPGDDETAPVTP